MSTVRGKAPLTLHLTESVETNSYGLKVIAKFRGPGFSCIYEMDTWSATRLIKELRKALRKVRDDATELLNSAVVDAEGPL